MKVLLDECLNWRLKKEFESHEVFTVQDMGWSGITNGKLMAKASEEKFEVFVTIDKNLPFQQNVRESKLAVVVFQTPLNRLEYIRPLMPTLLKKLPTMTPGEVYEIG